MEIVLSNAGKKYYREWIFRNVNLSFKSPERYVILGPNGSGKSTLLQLISGAITPTEGFISFSTSASVVPNDSIYKSLSIVAPYLELIEEFTLDELIRFHFSFKKQNESLRKTVLSETGLESKKNSVYRYFSSGMKQRVKLALAVCSDSELLLLDEPCSNLDKEGMRWYNELIQNHTRDKLIVVASNTVEDEYAFCTHSLNMSEFKHHE